MQAVVKGCGIMALVGVLAACTGPINSETVGKEPTGFLCRLLGPDYVTLPNEQRAIYAELERRGAECLPAGSIVVDQSVAVRTTK